MWLALTHNGKISTGKQPDATRLQAAELKRQHDIGNQESMFQVDPAHGAVLFTRTKFPEGSTHFLFEQCPAFVAQTIYDMAGPALVEIVELGAGTLQISKLISESAYHALEFATRALLRVGHNHECLIVRNLSLLLRGLFICWYGALEFLHPLNQFIVLGRDVVSFLHTVIGLFDEFIALGDEFLDGFVLLFDAVVSLFQLCLQSLHALLVFHDLIGQTPADELQPVELALLGQHDLVVGFNRLLQLGDAPIQQRDLPVHGFDGVGVALDGG